MGALTLLSHLMSVNSDPLEHLSLLGSLCCIDCYPEKIRPTQNLLV